MRNKDFNKEHEEKTSREKQRAEKELYDTKSANLTQVEYVDKQLLDPDISQRTRERLERKRKKLLASDKGISNKVRNRRIVIGCFIVALAIGITQICLYLT